MSLTTEFAIVGAGVAGCLLAYELARRGRAVTVLEAGSWVDRAEAVKAFRRDPYRGISSPYPESAWAPRPILEDLSHHCLQSGPELFMGLYERRVGGSSWHWLGTALRFLEEDFRMRTVHGVGEDWPLSLSDLEPYYRRAEVELGVAGPAPAPLPEHPFSLADSAVEAACRPLGLKLQALPQARNSLPHRGRPACCQSASCVPICPSGAKYDASLHARLAQDAGAVILSDSPVLRLVQGGDGRIRELVYRDSDGEKSLRAEHFIVACHGIETPRLLLASGLANSSDTVGRFLMGGTASLSWALSPQPVDPRTGPQASSGLHEQRSGAHRSQRSGFLTSVASDGWPHGNPETLLPEFLAQGVRGPELRQKMTQHLARQISLVSTCEELPEPQNRVTLDGAFPDALGVGRPRISYKISDYTLRGLPFAQEIHDRILKSMGASEIGHQSPAADSAYILGTTRMGGDPKASVVDLDLRSHDHPNLYVLGGSVFPTTGSAPPTLTIAALALRLSDFLGEMR